ncbi:ATP-binding cassette domain-containing protein [Lapidilactobacillus bayanensis]|uniref:ATP-binding cassette domain-containing protein n=1 Tax=Lapidilactobacillus bayanensis TaxID=2485998 RepID=UPI000F76B083|nr:ATP-binding cassette domain-containing protein [Lapidilactobacillus bayanensis]
MPTITLNDVSKNYKQKSKTVEALVNLDFTADPGEIIGLVGPNGAGKSTFVKLLCGILTPTFGKISVLGWQPDRNRHLLTQNIGVMFGNRSSLWFNIPAIESVYLMRDIYQIDQTLFKERLNKYSHILEVSDILQKPVREMSLGQRIRIELLVTILHQPKILILDEPTLGLDIVSKNHFRSILVELARVEQTTVILTTHDIQDVAKICDRIVLINHGKKLLDSTKTDFQAMISQQAVIQVRREENTSDLTAQPFLREENPEWYKFVLPNASKTEFLTQLMACQSDLQIQVLRPELEDILYDFFQ